MQAIFIDSSGKRTAATLVDGESLMTAALRNEIEWIRGDCGGSMACGTCHAHVIQGNQDLMPASEDEADLLSGEMDCSKSSRLLCQIVATPSLDGLIVRAPDFDI